MAGELILLSGGQGAGKTHFAHLFKVAGLVERIAFADAIRHHCNSMYPGLPWFARDQATKSAPYAELGGASVRDVLIREGERKVRENLHYWADRLGDAVAVLFKAGAQVVIVDDLRKLSEYGRINAWARDHGWHVTHVHMDGGEGDYDCSALRERADYVMARKFGPERECERGM